MSPEPVGTSASERDEAVDEATLARARHGELLTRITSVYRVSRFFFQVMFALYNRARIRGREHVPTEGPCLIVANHQSFLDIPLVAVAVRRHVCFVARDTLAKSRVIAFLIRWCGAVMVRRGTGDRAAIREILDHLEAGDAVCIFPEGTRSKNGRVGEFQRGMAVIARQAKAPIVPAGIRGSIDVLGPRGKFPRPVPCGIELGEPIQPSKDALAQAREAVVLLAGDGRFGDRPAQIRSQDDGASKPTRGTEPTDGTDSTSSTNSTNTAG